MDFKTIPAHFDGEKIYLDEPIELKPETKLLVTIVPEGLDEERNDWIVLSTKGLEETYGENEVEYSPQLIKEPNPEYKK